MEARVTQRHGPGLGDPMSRVAYVDGRYLPHRKITRPHAILFDWDNTLVDSWATIHEALNVVMAAMGSPLWSLQETKQRVRLSLRESFPLHFGERWEEAKR